MTPVQIADIIRNRADDGQSIADEKLAAARNSGQRMNEHSITYRGRLAVGRTRVVEKAGPLPSTHLSMALPLDRPNTNVWPAPERRRGASSLRRPCTR